MADQIIGKVLAEKYQIDSLMREGAVGNLYRGTHLLMEKPVCIKILPSVLRDNDAAVNSFAQEARTVSRISHPNILSVTDYGTDEDGTVFIVFEDASGETLKEIVNRVGKLSLKRANRVVQEIESVLTVAHNSGIFHQNLNSENILVQPVGINSEAIKILNFGTAPFDINDLDYPVGKAQYLAPEQFSLNGRVDERSDVYALGVILYEMLAGKVPLDAATTTDLMERQRQEMPPPINAFRDDLPAEVDDILLKALAKNPEIRYASVQEFAEELNNVSLSAKDNEGEDTIFIPAVSAVLPSNSAPVQPEEPQNNLWKTAFIVLAGIVLLGGSFIYLTSGKQTNPSTQVVTDANGMPVQPVNPATGATEQGLANMNDFNPSLYGSNANNGIPDGGGGTYNPYWDSGTRPPGAPPVSSSSGGYGPPVGGSPYYVPPSNMGPQVYVDPANGSIFFPNENNTYTKMVPVNPSNSNVNTQPGQKKNANTNVNTATPPSANTAVKPSPNPPAANTATPTEVKPKTTATPKPTEVKPKPTATPPSTTDKRPVSGKQQDTEKQ